MPPLARPSAAPHTVRRERERDLIRAARALFDERGVHDVSLDVIAKAVGISKPLIYRHFGSKEELFVLTVTAYLGEIGDRFESALADVRDPVDRLRAICETYVDYCLEFPAFLDCTLSLMQRPARELNDRLSPGVWFQLGQGIARPLGMLAGTIEAGQERGVFRAGDAAFESNRIYVQMLGTCHLARSGVGVKEIAPGLPSLFEVTSTQVRRSCSDAVVASVLALPEPGSTGRDGRVI